MDHAVNFENGRPTLIAWRAANMPKHMQFYAVPDPTAAAWLILGLIIADLENHDVFSNAFGLMELEDGEWTEWYHEDTGDDIMAVVDALDDTRRKAVLEPKP